ncbi:MAG TPA: discoidin domain-containing protein [Burkholderiaceae bacterium]|jgi:hypothetical protein
MKFLLLAALMALPAHAVDLREPWTADASTQVQARVTSERVGQCLHYDFAGVSGYAVMRRALPISWPADFMLRANVQGDGGANSLQLKFVDASGENVWWLNKPGFAPSAKGQQLRARRRNIDFAWGPNTDKTLRQTAAVELVVASTGPGATGGRGTVCLTGLSLTPQAPLDSAPPLPRISGHGAHLTVDLGRERDFSGLLLRWAKAPRDLRVSGSTDGKHWQALSHQHTGTLTALYLPESSARWLRLDGDAAMRLSSFSVPSPEPGGDADWPNRNAMLSALARELPKGDLPRAFLGEQNYWTLVGLDGGGERSALISEDGAIEIGRGGASVEPQLRLFDGNGNGNGRWLNWSNAAIGQSLADGDLPVPSVHLAWPGLQLDVNTAADGEAAAPRLLARYTLHNTGKTALTLNFGLALRPWQVNPPQQFLNTPGGFSAVDQLSWQGDQLQLNGQAWMRPLFAPDAVHALPFASGLALNTLAAAPAVQDLNDPQRMASALIDKSLTLAPGESRSLDVVFALAATARLDAPFDIGAVEARWRARLGRLTVQLPPGQEALAQTLHAALAQVLMSRDGPGLRPGTRSYARSWIRDGAMMSAALLRMGEVDAARDFVDWFGPQIFANGKVPCCLDSHGADPVAENDSHGEYLFAVAEVWRATKDKAWLAKQWPRVQSVVAYMDQLRAETQNDKTPANARGLMPPSISHEGYSDKAAYSFWDDWWSLRGYKDAVQMAQALGHDSRAFEHSRDAFAADLAASVRATAVQFQLQTLSGAADRGDVDPTSSTMALDPAQGADLVPTELLATTFTQYAADAAARAAGTRPQGDYTPYELRNIGALIRLGHADEAQALLDFFFADQRPRAWRQWAEVVGREARTPRFIGDMPHAWVSSDFLRSALDIFGYENETDHTIVIGAGITSAWRHAGDVGVSGLMLSGQRLDWQLQRRGAGWHLSITQTPAARLLLAWPGTDPLPRATFKKGQPLSWQGRELPIPVGITEIDLGDPTP